MSGANIGERTGLLILAAGKGTRMRSQLPKVLHRAGGRSLLGHVLAAAAEAGIAAADTAVVVGYGKDAIQAALAAGGAGAVTLIVQEPQLGTGHAVQAAQAWWQRYARVLVVHGDMPLLAAATLIGLAAQQPAHACAAVLATATPSTPRAYGRILRDPQRPERVTGIVEERVATPQQRLIRELNAGFYCFETGALAEALGQLGTDNPHKEYYLTDTVAILARRGEAVEALALADERECLGVNDRYELAQLDQFLRRRKADELLRAGVSIELPDTVVIDPEVTVGQDTTLESGVHLLGATRIGEGCRIRAHSVLENAVVADAAVIGPFARLREGAEIGAAAHIGNFVEVKKSRIGSGSKANHLAYLGDATVGAGANIGAGTITCNYDGVNKHRTAIGAQAFVGSNSTLVAPVEIGDGAYIAAGSVITEPVAADALALGRARQVEKPGWAAKRRAARKKSN
ncbi:MAG: bifunctional UDP-N-acetylglucosamine diphosphorylase/glucosamine-1-phosphate N-acetyltransferase GlmU [Terriglobales bacterium]